MNRQGGRYLVNYLGLALLAGFYLFAGVNHFRDPEFYFPLIPPFFQAKELINVLAGIAEILLGAGLLFPRLRNISSYLIILMLLAFIPSHVYFIQIGGCADAGLCVPEWIAWMRLIVVHPLLILWVWRYRNSEIRFGAIPGFKSN